MKKVLKWCENVPWDLESLHHITIWRVLISAVHFTFRWLPLLKAECYWRTYKWSNLEHICARSQLHRAITLLCNLPTWQSSVSAAKQRAQLLPCRLPNFFRISRHFSTSNGIVDWSQILKIFVKYWSTIKYESSLLKSLHKSTFMK